MAKDISKLLKSLPELSGIYLMKDTYGHVIYIGKAINLRKRIKSYFSGNDNRFQIDNLLAKLEDIDFIVTQDERQALILEADLVKLHMPKFNIRLKDDKAPLLIKIDRTQKWPRLELVRQKKNDQSLYFGPFPFSYEARTLLDLIEKTIPLRTCTDKVLKNRVRPCLQFQIHRCVAPCCFEISSSEYDAWLEEAIKILNGELNNVIKSMELQIKYASDELRFEDAAQVRDRLKILKKLSSDKKNVFFGNSDLDAFGIYREGSQVEVSILKTRQGRLASASSFGFSDVSISDEEIIRSVLLQYYLELNSNIPSQILLPLEVDKLKAEQELFSEKVNKKIEFSKPLKGLKSRLMDLANVNSKESFEARFHQDKKNDRILKALESTFKLEQYPRVIECFDISHIQGMATVGAVVCFKDGRPETSRYRYFHLSQEGKPDDFASMNEIVRRHLIRTSEEGTTSDLIIIDGGPPQLIQALKVRAELGLNYPNMISIAKKRVPLKFLKVKSPRDVFKQKKPERVYVEHNPFPIILEPNNEVLQLIERIRNETHRAAITFHRKTRSRLQFKSPLDLVKGLGEGKKKILLREFGSIESLKSYTDIEIANRTGISLKLAKEVLLKLIPSVSK